MSKNFPFIAVITAPRRIKISAGGTRIIDSGPQRIERTIPCKTRQEALHRIKECGRDGYVTCLDKNAVQQFKVS